MTIAFGASDPPATASARRAAERGSSPVASKGSSTIRAGRPCAQRPRERPRGRAASARAAASASSTQRGRGRRTTSRWARTMTAAVAPNAPTTMPATTSSSRRESASASHSRVRTTHQPATHAARRPRRRPPAVRDRRTWRRGTRSGPARSGQVGEIPGDREDRARRRRGPPGPAPALHRRPAGGRRAHGVARGHEHSERLGLHARAPEGVGRAAASTATPATAPTG